MLYAEMAQLVPTSVLLERAVTPELAWMQRRQLAFATL